MGQQLARPLSGRAGAGARFGRSRPLLCPEQAIYLRKDYAITGFTRADMVHHKEKLLEIGGVMHGVVLKWNEKK